MFVFDDHLVGVKAARQGALSQGFVGALHHSLKECCYKMRRLGFALIFLLWIHLLLPKNDTPIKHEAGVC
jgi:hypothetical protein